jgi:GNAT superfamily N-acetyltransferase
VTLLVRLGEAADIAGAVSVFERSEMARRQDAWPGREAQVARIHARLRAPASWFLVAAGGSELAGMAYAKPLRGGDGTGPLVPGSCFLGLLYVVPERWGEGVGGALVDAVLAESKRRHYTRLHLLTHQNNERSHRLYRGRGFSPTGRTVDDRGEWARPV